MKLKIGHEHHEFIPVKTFRAQHDLPALFGVELFAPKDFVGLGRIDHAGSELNVVRQAVLDAIPAGLTLAGWLEFLPDLARLFQNKLDEINPQVGLKSVEIEYAVSGFQDVCQSFIYALIRAQAAGGPLPTFGQVYQEWLDDSVTISNMVHHYIHQGEMWAVQVVSHAYGRSGLMIWTNADTHYVHDTAIACPAEGFTFMLLRDVAGFISQSAGSPQPTGGLAGR